MPLKGLCADVTCNKQLTELYECHCCNWRICIKHLLEHIDVSQKHKQEQLDIHRSELQSISRALESIVEKKIHEIEREKQLLNRAKLVLNTSAASIEEIQEIREQLSLAITSNQKEETIVKVEPTLFDVSSSSYNAESIEKFKKDEPSTTDLHLSSANTVQSPPSPVYRSFHNRRNKLRPKFTYPDDDSTDSDLENYSPHPKMKYSCKDEQTDENDKGNVHDKSIISKGAREQCPLIFDGAFGFTKAMHGINICPAHRSYQRNLMQHLRNTHKLKGSYAHGLLRAVRDGLDPHKTKLVHDNDDVIDNFHIVQCPFTNDMIKLIGRCPTESRRIPCQNRSILAVSLTLHLKQYHRINSLKARQITRLYREKLSKIDNSQN